MDVLRTKSRFLDGKTTTGGIVLFSSRSTFWHRDCEILAYFKFLRQICAMFGILLIGLAIR